MGGRTSVKQDDLTLPLILAMANFHHYKDSMEQIVEHLNQSESRVIIP